MRLSSSTSRSSEAGDGAFFLSVVSASLLVRYSSTSFTVRPVASFCPRCRMRCFARPSSLCHVSLSLLLTGWYAFQASSTTSFDALGRSKCRPSNASALAFAASATACSFVGIFRFLNLATCPFGSGSHSSTIQKVPFLAWYFLTPKLLRPFWQTGVDQECTAPL